MAKYTKTRPSLLSRLPLWISHWLGHRSGSSTKALPVYLQYLWTFIGSFCGLAILLAIFGYALYFEDRKVPPIVASYGASAALCYGAIESPLAQPRALVGGHFLSALTGVIITHIFSIPPSNVQSPSDNLSWLAASLAAAIAVVLMQATKTLHPPAGATALLPVVDASINGLGWYFLPVILLSSVLILVVALINNNIQRRYPVFWIAPQPPTTTLKKPETSTVSAANSGVDVEKALKEPEPVKSKLGRTSPF